MKGSLIVFALFLASSSFGQNDPPFGDTCVIYLPNQISGCGDGMTIPFGPHHNCPLANYEMNIYNRWGEVMFTTTDPDIGWNPFDQPVNGRQVPGGPYYYIMSYTDLSSVVNELKGYVNVIK